MAQSFKEYLAARRQAAGNINVVLEYYDAEKRGLQSWVLSPEQEQFLAEQQRLEEILAFGSLSAEAQEELLRGLQKISHGFQVSV